MNKTRCIIAIDGTAASGKGTLARKLSEQLDYAFLDTGALYRVVAKHLIDQGKTADDKEGAALIAQNLMARFDPELLDDPAIRTDEVGQVTSKISAIPEVREALLTFQRDFAKNPPLLANGLPAKGAILDGRDIGTAVCPDADIKLYIDAPVEIRAERRHKELQSKGISVTYEAVLADMRERDARDAGRKTAPMKIADDAAMLDTGTMSVEDVMAAALQIIGNKTGMDIR